MWSFVSSWNVARRIRILDNSVGSGRLLQFADPERHAVYGIDVHDDVIAHRLPRGFRYAGQGLLDMETYLVQPDPLVALEELLGRIRAVGGVPRVSPGFLEHFQRRASRSQRQATPLRHVAWTTGAGSMDAVDRVHGR